MSSNLPSTRIVMGDFDEFDHGGLTGFHRHVVMGVQMACQSVGGSCIYG